MRLFALAALIGPPVAQSWHAGAPKFIGCLPYLTCLCRPLRPAGGGSGRGGAAGQRRRRGGGRRRRQAWVGKQAQAQGRQGRGWRGGHACTSSQGGASGRRHRAAGSGGSGAAPGGRRRGATAGGRRGGGGGGSSPAVLDLGPASVGAAEPLCSVAEQGGPGICGAGPTGRRPRRRRRQPPDHRAQAAARWGGRR